MLNVKVVTCSLGIFAAVSFTLCVVGGVLFVWRSSAPFVSAGILMFCIGIAAAWAKSASSQS